ncbi:LuxR C-terminal-related transcriptional regulator [Nonomuraea dietziae]|uniref:LuxR C-terminal-related transcriptional regulator n=1 Tax=Nonomuraea dietziae TaxID=65515 RepID=UPI00343D8230
MDTLAENTYRLLLTNNDLDIEGIARELAVSPDEIRLALDRLAELALLRPSWESPGTLRPVQPDVGLQLLLERQQAELLRQQHQLAESRTAISQLVSEYSGPGMSGPSCEPLRGMDAIQARIEQLASRATAEVATFMPGGPQDAELIKAAMLIDQQVLERGVAIRTIALDSAHRHPGTLAYLRWLTEAGAQVRTAPALPLRMLIYDRRVALLPIDPHNSAAGAVQVTDRGTLTAVLALFEQFWASAAPLDAAPAAPAGPAGDDPGLSRQERELLRLLMAGLTDEGAGRQLGLSPRTIRRMMADIMKRLDARSRFEAGARAAERKWI